MCIRDSDKIVLPLDSQKTYRIVENLVSNVTKYSLRGSRVYLTLIERGEEVVLSIRNISQTEIDFDPNDLVERFVRGDKSRNSEGSGPVSYTHLDVYKRQTLDDAMKRLRQIAPLNAMRVHHKAPCVETGKCMDCQIQQSVCNSVGIINHGRKTPGRFTIIMIADEIGF